MRISAVALLAALLAAAPAAASAQVVVENYSTWNGSDGWLPFGLGPDATDAYGQSFVAPAQYLNSWSFWARGYEGADASGLLFTANVGTWTGSSVGSVLWTSALTAGTASSSYQEFAFNTGGVSLLTGGQSYIFFLDAVSGPGAMQVGGLNFSADYTGGTFNFQNGTDHASAWDGIGGDDLAFRAEFDRVPDGDQETVPEPATMSLLATGLVGLGASRRRKRRA